MKTVSKPNAAGLAVIAMTGFTVQAAAAAPVLTTLLSFDGTNGGVSTAGLTLDLAGN